MKVTSPVGTFPFEARRLRIADRKLTVEGQMGAWPATVQVGPGDLAALVRLGGPRAALSVVGALALGVVLGAGLRRGRRGVER